MQRRVGHKNQMGVALPSPLPPRESLPPLKSLQNVSDEETEVFILRVQKEYEEDYLRWWEEVVVCIC